MIDVIVQSPKWDGEPGIEATLCRAIGETALVLHDARALAGEVTLVLTDDAAIRELNRTWRGIDRPTNVLSFEAAPAPPGFGEVAGLLGDIVIALEISADEARADGKPFTHHAAHLAVHGMLHLMGYDHQTDEDAETMERLERRILARLGIPDPYALEIELDRHA